MVESPEKPSGRYSVNLISQNFSLQSIIIIFRVFLLFLQRQRKYLMSWTLMTVLSFFPEAGMVLFMSLYYWVSVTEKGVKSIFIASENCNFLILLGLLFTSKNVISTKSKYTQYVFNNLASMVP